MMIARTWNGRADSEHASAYVEHLRRSVLPQLESIDGFRGAYVLQRDDERETAFQVITLWATMDAVRMFAGEQPDVAVVEPEARAVLSSFDGHVTHFEVALACGVPS